MMWCALKIFFTLCFTIFWTDQGVLASEDNDQAVYSVQFRVWIDDKIYATPTVIMPEGATGEVSKAGQDGFQIIVTMSDSSGETEKLERRNGLPSVLTSQLRVELSLPVSAENNANLERIFDANFDLVPNSPFRMNKSLPTTVVSPNSPHSFAQEVGLEAILVETGETMSSFIEKATACGALGGENSSHDGLYQYSGHTLVAHSRQCCSDGNLTCCWGALCCSDGTTGNGCCIRQQ